MKTRAVLVISDLQGGDYQVALVDEARFEQINEACEVESPDYDAVDVVSYLIGTEQDASAARASRPDLYPERRGRLLGTKFTQDFVVEDSEDWPEVHIFSIITVPCT